MDATIGVALPVPPRAEAGRAFGHAALALSHIWVPEAAYGYAFKPLSAISWKAAKAIVGPAPL